MTQQKKLNKKKKTSYPSFEEIISIRRKTKRHSPPIFFFYFSLSITDDDPRNVKEVVDSEDSDLWKKAMVEEMDALDKNETWDLVELPAKRKVVGNKCMFKKNLNVEGKVEKYKSCLVENGYSRVEGIDFGNIFYPVAKLTSIRFFYFHYCFF